MATKQAAEKVVGLAAAEKVDRAVLVADAEVQRVALAALNDLVVLTHNLRSCLKCSELISNSFRG